MSFLAEQDMSFLAEQDRKQRRPRLSRRLPRPASYADRQRTKREGSLLFAETAAILGGVGRLAPKISALVGISWIPSNIFGWSFTQRFVMAAYCSHVYQSLKVRIDLPKLAQNERIAGRQYAR
jgi:hypothetical protein